MQNRGNIKLGLILVLLLVAGLAATIFLIGKKQQLGSRADSASAVLTIAPSSAGLPTTVKVYLDPVGEKVVFVRVGLKFDNSQIRLTSDPTVSPKFGNVISLWEMQQANDKGKIVVVALVNPGEEPVSSVVDLLSLSFEAVTPTVLPNGNNINFDTSDSQILALPQNSLNPKATGARLYTTVNTQDKAKVNADLGLKLSVRKNSESQSYIYAVWNPVPTKDVPLFENFTVAVRNASTNTLFGSKDDRNVGNTTYKAFDDLLNIPQGDYFVNLRAYYNQKIVIQTPVKIFNVGSEGAITIK